MTRRAVARPALTLGAVGMALGVSACGDPLVSGDYVGPPATTVNANVVPAAMSTTASSGQADTEIRPRSSIQWLDGTGLITTGGGTALIQQSISSAHGAGLLDPNSVDISLQWPSSRARFQTSASTTSARISVGKVVFFDDRVDDGIVDWACSGTACDVVESVSAQFVVYVDNPPTCFGDLGQRTRALVSAGWHYYGLDTDGKIIELEADQSLSLPIAKRDPASVNLAQELSDFTTRLVASWTPGLHGC